jgi:hypothetical protein
LDARRQLWQQLWTPLKPVLKRVAWYPNWCSPLSADYGGKGWGVDFANWSVTSSGFFLPVQTGYQLAGVWPRPRAAVALACHSGWQILTANPFPLQHVFSGAVLAWHFYRY